MSAPNSRSSLFYRICRVIATPIILLFLPVRYEGLENLPRDRGYILVCNHRSALDPVYLAFRLSVQPRFMAKEELFKNRFAGWFLKKLGAFAVSRGHGDLHALNEAERITREGGVMGLFPEGTRCRNGGMLPFKAGAALIAAQTGADVLPASICAEKEKYGFCKRAVVRFGKLIPNERFAFSERPQRSELKNATQLMRSEIAGLLGIVGQPDEERQA